MTVLRHRVLNSSNQPVAGKTATVALYDGNKYALSDIYTARQKNPVTATSGADGWIQWELPPSGMGSKIRYVVVGIEDSPFIVAVPRGVSTALISETRVKPANTNTPNVVTEEELEERLAGYTPGGDGTGGAVASVNGKTGAVVLDAEDVGAVSDDEAAPLAVSGSGQDPLPDAKASTVGTQASAARADHVHPVSLAGRSLFFGARGRTTETGPRDVVFDGVVTFPYLQRTGSVYSPNNEEAKPWGNRPMYGYTGRNIRIEEGISYLHNIAGSSFLKGHGLLLQASDTIEINGTLDVSGRSAVGAAGGGQDLNWTSSWAGGKGGAGGTGAGANGGYPFNDNEGDGFGGAGGAGGVSGSTAGGTGARRAFSFSRALPATAQELMFMHQMWNNHNGNWAAGGGGGGGAGAGDGSNAGGGGGQGSNLLILLAPRIIIGPNAVIRSNGGNGAAGAGGNAGGGGGGGGGVISMQAFSLSISPTAVMTANGGAGGAGSGTGLPGVAGTTSSVFVDPPKEQGGYGFGAGFFLTEWA